MITNGLCLWKQNLRGEDVGKLDQDAAELDGGVVVDKNDFSDDKELSDNTSEAQNVAIPILLIFHSHKSSQNL